MPDVVLYNHTSEQFILLQYKFVYNNPYGFLSLGRFAGKYIITDMHQIGCATTPI